MKFSLTFHKEPSPRKALVFQQLFHKVLLLQLSSLLEHEYIFPQYDQLALDMEPNLEVNRNKIN